MAPPIAEAAGWISLYRFLAPHPDAGAYPILETLVALAQSTYAQSLFSLDGGPGEGLVRDEASRARVRDNH